MGRPKGCRFCGAPLHVTFVDLGVSPLANRYLESHELNREELFYPLRAYICAECLLVQLEEFESPVRIFSDYAYFSSYSESWLEHAREYVRKAIKRFRLDDESLVIEIGSNDGYLLQYLVREGIPVLGIEPAANVAPAAEEKGVPTLIRFFSKELAEELTVEGRLPDLLLGNNVLAHVPELNNFVAGMKVLLRPGGVITMEFPHLQRLIEQNQFDTIYHEHFSYFSLSTARRILEAHGLRIFDVEELPTHGGSLRIYACHAEENSEPPAPSVSDVVAGEEASGLATLEGYLSFSERVRDIKLAVLEFLIEAKRDGRAIAAYGAPAKGNTLLNYCGIGTDFIEYTVDRNPVKQGRFLPGSRIPIHSPAKIAETRPDYVLILPWNLKEEIVGQMSHIREWGGKFVVAIPDLQVF
ncbi:MAG: methyltransferase domain-containing protein [Dehalococcoidia bacterium]